MLQKQVQPEGVGRKRRGGRGDLPQPLLMFLQLKHSCPGLSHQEGLLSHSQHLKYREETPRLDSPACIPAVSAAAHGRPRCPACGVWTPILPATTTTTTTMELPTSDLHSGPQALQASPPKSALPSQAIIPPSLLVGRGQQGPPKPLPAPDRHTEHAAGHLPPPWGAGPNHSEVRDQSLATQAVCTRIPVLLYLGCTAHPNWSRSAQAEQD